MPDVRLGGAYVDIKANRKPLKRGLDAAENDVKGSVGKMNKRIGGITFAQAAVAASAFGALAVAGFNKAVRAASDLQETTSKFYTVFARQEDKADDFTRSLIDGYAMSTTEARELYGAK